MKRLNQLAANLYPRWWRDRYAAEFGALLDDARPSFRSTFDILKGAFFMQITTVTPLRIFAFCSLIGIGVAYAAYAVPETATSRALMIVRGLETPDRETELNERAAQASVIVLSRPSLVNILRNQNQMFRRELMSEPQQSVVDRLRSHIRISIEPMGVGRAVSVEVDRPFRPLHFSGGPSNYYEDPTAGNYQARVLLQSVVTQIIDESVREGARTGEKPWDLLEPPSFPESLTRGHRDAAILLGLPGSIVIGALLAWWYRRRSRNMPPPASLGEPATA